MAINLIDAEVKRKISDVFLPKAEEIYQGRENRNEMLSQQGWSRHLLHEFKERLYLGEVYEEEQSRYGLELLKRYLSFGLYSSPIISEYNELFYSRALPRIKRYDCIEQQPQVAENLASVMKNKEDEAYSSEVDYFCKGLSNIVFEDQTQLVNFIADEIKSSLPEFKYDSRFSSKGLLIFSKSFFGSWKIIISIDNDQLRKYFTPSWDGSVKNNRFYMGLSLCHEKNRTLRGEDKVLLYFLRNYLFTRFSFPWFYKTSNQLRTHLLYELTCFKYELDFFEKPIFDVFSELDAIGYSN